MLNRLKRLNQSQQKDMNAEQRLLEQQAEMKRRMEARAHQIDRLVEQVEAEVRMLQGNE